MTSEIIYTNNDPEDPSLASLEDGEAVIPADFVDKYKDAVEELVSKYEVAVEEQKLIEEAKASATISEAVEENNVITAPGKKTGKKPKVVTVADGIIASRSASKPNKEKKASAQKTETVAIYSTKNVTWSGVGKVYRGYNIVSVIEADKWIQRDHIRLATPEEVAKEFGK
jgi:DNA-binding protein H-NS